MYRQLEIKGALGLLPPPYMKKKKKTKNVEQRKP